MISNQLSNTWKLLLKDEINAPYFKELNSFLENAYQNKVIYPPNHQIFNAFSIAPNDIKVVILGQDPYPEEGQAHGYSFSVPENVRIPKSLLNINKELLSDLKKDIPEHGNLEHWVDQGVFLLNAALTVEKGFPLSHQNIGWLKFTDAVIKLISKQQNHVVFMLWGNFAKTKAKLIDSSKHLILKAAHPSPLSAYRGFFGCQHFSLANSYLIEHNKNPIQW